jgi:hypothetical protein
VGLGALAVERIISTSEAAVPGGAAQCIALPGKREPGSIKPKFYKVL